MAPTRNHDDGSSAFLDRIYAETTALFNVRMATTLTKFPTYDSFLIEYNYWSALSLEDFSDVDFLCEQIHSKDFALTPQQRSTLLALKQGIIRDIVAELGALGKQGNFPPLQGQLQNLAALADEWDKHDAYVVLITYIVRLRCGIEDKALLTTG
jgi:hypothetical protein